MGDKQFSLDEEKSLLAAEDMDFDDMEEDIDQSQKKEDIEEKHEKKTWRKVLGLALTALSGIFFTASNLFVQLSHNTAGVPPLETAFARNFVQLLLVIPFLVYQRTSIKVERKHIHCVLLLGLASVVNLGLLFYAFDILPLGDATVIIFTAPIFTSVLGYFLLKESCTKADIIGGILGFSGILLVSRPTILFGPRNKGDGEALDVSSQEHVWAILADLFGTFCLAITYVLIRKVSTTLTTMATVFYISFFGATFLPLASLIMEQPVIPKIGKDWMELILVGVFGFAGTYTLNKGLQLEKAGPAILMRNLDMVYAFSLQFLVMGIVPSVWSICGGLIIVAATGLIVLHKWWKLKQKAGERAHDLSLDQE